MPVRKRVCVHHGEDSIRLGPLAFVWDPPALIGCNPQILDLRFSLLSLTRSIPSRYPSSIQYRRIIAVTRSLLKRRAAGAAVVCNCRNGVFCIYTYLTADGLSKFAACMSMLR